MFHNFFMAGLRFSVDPVVLVILGRFNAKLHQLTPNAIVCLSKFLLVAKTFKAPADADALCHFF